MGTGAQNFRLIWGLFHLFIIVQQIISKLSGLIRENHFSFLVISVGQEFGSCSVEQFWLGDCMMFQSEAGSWQEASFPHHMGISVRRLGWLPPEQVIRGGQGRSHRFFVTLPQKSHMSFLWYPIGHIGQSFSAQKRLYQGMNVRRRESLGAILEAHYHRYLFEVLGCLFHLQSLYLVSVM